MTTEQQLRDQLDRATTDVPASPDLETAVRRGRRRRQYRRGGLALAAVAVVGLGSAGVVAATSGDDGGPTVAQDAPVAAAPAATTDWVAGTDIDTDLADLVAAQLPSLPAPDDVYPSDSHTAGPMPDADFAQAEDWQATYTVGDSTFLVMMAAPSEGGVRCQGCEKKEVPGGTLYHQTFTSPGPNHWYFGVYLARPDGSAVSAYESLTAPDEATAIAQRQLTDAEVEALVQDPGLRFSGS